MNPPPNPETQIFIVRVWLEPREVEGVRPIWRGVIEHVPSGKRRYLQDLTHIISFIIPYFREAGFETGAFWRWRLQLKKLKWLLRSG